jgi:hypothetical protein
LPAETWESLATAAEALSVELETIERELMNRPDLWDVLGMARAVQQTLESDEPWTPTAARVIRFDFHPTLDGWRISEANSDVPGGYTESSRFSAMMAEHEPAARLAGDPTASLCGALCERANEHGRIGLIAAPGYVDDQQIVAQIAAGLSERGIETATIRPEQLSWRSGLAHAGGSPLDAIFRFHNGEWSTRVHTEDWRLVFRGGRTAVCNPGAAVLSESKRLPLLWPELETPAPAWREFLPPTRAASAAWSSRDDWVLKAAYSNTGDAVLARGWARPSDYWLAFAHAAISPRTWIAQQRFDTIRLPTPLGPLHPCIGVYTVNGKAAGIYGRLAVQPVVDCRAFDTAVLIEN